MKLAELSALGVPPDLVDRWASDFEALTDVQEQAIRVGLLTESTNLLVAAPTSSGKTFIVPVDVLAGPGPARLTVRQRDGPAATLTRVRQTGRHGPP
jgi:superfamily II DNA/RNA helicase